MISNSSTKSSRCIGRSLASAVAPALLVVGQDHLAHGDDAVGLEEHVLGAAEPDAFGAELARRARRRAACRRWCGPSACGPRRPSPSARRSRPTARAATVGTAPSITSPVRAVEVMMSPASTDRAAHLTACWPCVVDRARRRRPRRRACPCRARPRPRGWSCRRAWSGCPRRRACRGCPRGWSRAHQDHLLAGARRLLGLVGGEHDLARRRARRRRQALGDHLALGLGIERRDAAAGRARPGSMRATASSWSISPSRTMSTAILQRRRGRALAVAGLQHVELALLDRELDVLHVAVVLLELLRAPRRAARTPSGIASSMAGASDFCACLALRR